MLISVSPKKIKNKSANIYFNYTTSLKDEDEIINTKASTICRHKSGINKLKMEEELTMQRSTQQGQNDKYWPTKHNTENLKFSKI